MLSVPEMWKIGLTPGGKSVQTKIRFIVSTLLSINGLSLLLSFANQARATVLSEKYRIESIHSCSALYTICVVSTISRIPHNSFLGTVDDMNFAFAVRSWQEYPPERKG